MSTSAEVVDKVTADERTLHIGEGTLHRNIDWKHAFWVASGVPPLVLFTVGAIAATVGQPAWVIWILSILMGFIQCFTYAEISGLFPHKSGGASIYGAIGWVRYGKFIAPVTVWCNWIAWSPVLAIASGLAGAYILLGLFPADAVVNTWSLTIVDLGFIKEKLSLRINATFVIGAALLLMTFAMQHRGVLKAAKLQKIMGIAALLPLLVIGIVPLVTGDVPSDRFFPLLPLAHDAAGQIIQGSWNAAGWTLAIGGMFVAAWSTYGFETAVCYTREFKDPKKDTFKAVLSAGLIMLVTCTLVPLALQGALGLDGLLDPKIYDGTGVGLALAQIVGGGPIVANIIVVMLLLSLVLAIMTAMMGSSRTLYQASVDGWFPRYLSKVNKDGAPTAAMWTDLGFNLILLMMSDYLFVLAVSNVCYIFFIFMNLQSGWIHRMDRPHWDRPFKCPNWLLGLGAFLGFVNMAFVGAGADIWGEGTLRNGLITITLIIPIFVFRHYIQDKGKFPDAMLEDMELRTAGSLTKNAGVLPYLALILCGLVVWISHKLAVLPT